MEQETRGIPRISENPTSSHPCYNSPQPINPTTAQKHPNSIGNKGDILAMSPRRRYQLLATVLAVASFSLVSASPTRAAAENPRPTATTTRALAPVLLIDDSNDPAADAWYQNMMDNMFGVGTWDRYDLATQGLPDPPELFLNTLAQYQGVLWYRGVPTPYLAQAEGPLLDYLDPATPGYPAGRLIVVLSSIYDLSPTLLSVGLGVSPTASPLPGLTIPEGTKALGFGLEATDLVAFGYGLSGIGLQPLAGAETITRLEPCVRCYSTRPPYDPIVGVRRADVINPSFARSAIFGIPLHQFTGAASALQDLMKYQMGFIPAFEQVLGADNIRTTINGAGYVGSFFSSPDRPSLVYPYPSHVENLYHGGLWIGAQRPDGSLGVSTSADQYSTAAAGEEVREFAPYGEPLRVISNIPTSDYYDATAVAPWQAECVFQDQITIPGPNHQPLGLSVHLRAMSWNAYPVDDAVVLEYRIVNTSAGDLRDVYVGFFADMTVGNTELTTPYGSTEPGTLGWNWYDDMNGAWRPGDDQDIWMMWEHDADGDQGLATGWIGCQLLGSDRPAAPTAGRAPVSYNAEVFRDWPVTDDTALDPESGQLLPGRYQVLGNGDFDVGVTPDGDFSLASDWAGLLSTGPFPLLAAGDTLTVTFALVGGDDGWHLQRNGSRWQQQFFQYRCGGQFSPRC